MTSNVGDSGNRKLIRTVAWHSIFSGLPPSKSLLNFSVRGGVAPLRCPGDSSVVSHRSLLPAVLCCDPLCSCACCCGGFAVRAQTALRTTSFLRPRTTPNMMDLDDGILTSAATAASLAAIGGGAGASSAAASSSNAAAAAAAKAKALAALTDISEISVRLFTRHQELPQVRHTNTHTPHSVRPPKHRASCGLSVTRQACARGGACQSVESSNVLTGLPAPLCHL